MHALNARRCLCVCRQFNELVYQYPIRIPERFSLVIRSLLTQASASHLRRVTARAMTLHGRAKLL